MSAFLAPYLSFRSHPSAGFSLIDVIVGTALMLVIFLALFGVLRASLILSALAKANAAATEIANSQMEYLHGISYDTIGTIGGIPAGSVAQNATSTVDGIDYGVRTYIVYKDDPADGLGAADTNNITTDYKMGKVVVTYTMYGSTKSVVLASNFVPPGIETATGGGTLSIHAVDATGADVSGATVHIINTSLTPSVDFTTFTNTSGYSIVDGAATSSDYQIYVSDSGYSSAQTYARTTSNANPNPGYLTIVKNTTTGATFAIDKLTNLTLASFSPAVLNVFSDAFPSSVNLSNRVNTQVLGNTLTLDNTALFGSALSIPISGTYLDGWGILSASLSAPASTTAVVHITDSSGVLLPNSVLPGNSAGFSSFPISLTGIATSSYPSLMLKADFTRTDLTATSSISSWSLSHTDGPTPLPNIAYTLTGAKTIGTTASGTPLYKTIVTDTTGASAVKTETLEWDVYTPTFGSSHIIESCIPSPYALMPGTATTTNLLIGAPTVTALPVFVADSLGNPISEARVVLTTPTYAETIPTSACGLAYFNALTAGTYKLTASAPGYATTTLPSVSVVGNTSTTTITLP